MNQTKVKIASHRGCFGGNIVENTLPAFETALRCGADIVETDIHKTKDNVMILFHDNSPKRLLGLAGDVADYTLEELRSRPLLNAIGNPSGHYVNTLEELLVALKGRCMINLDQCWHFIDNVYAMVAAHGMEEQALIKSRAPYDDAIAWLQKHDYAPRFIPVITCDEELKQFHALPKELRLPQVEVFFHNDTDELISHRFVTELHDRGLQLWVNALSLGSGIDLSAHHDDQVSLTVSPEDGWGWLVAHGADVIQTDWTAPLRRYLDTIGR